MGTEWKQYDSEWCVKGVENMTPFRNVSCVSVLGKLEKLPPTDYDEEVFIMLCRWAYPKNYSTVNQGKGRIH